MCIELIQARPLLNPQGNMSLVMRGRVTAHCDLVLQLRFGHAADKVGGGPAPPVMVVIRRGGREKRKKGFSKGPLYILYPHAYLP